MAKNVPLDMLLDETCSDASALASQLDAWTTAGRIVHHRAMNKAGFTPEAVDADASIDEGDFCTRMHWSHDTLVKAVAKEHVFFIEENGGGGTPPGVPARSSSVATRRPCVGGSRGCPPAASGSSLGHRKSHWVNNLRSRKTVRRCSFSLLEGSSDIHWIEPQLPVRLDQSSERSAVLFEPVARDVLLSTLRRHESELRRTRHS